MVASRSRKTNCPNKKMKASTNQRTNFTTADRSTTRPDTVFSPTKMPFFSPLFTILPLKHFFYLSCHQLRPFITGNFGDKTVISHVLFRRRSETSKLLFLSLFLLWLLTWTNLRKYINNSNYKSWILIAFP